MKGTTVRNEPFMLLQYLRTMYDKSIYMSVHTRGMQSGLLYIYHIGRALFVCTKGP